MDEIEAPRPKSPPTATDARAARAVRSIVCLSRAFEQACRGTDLSLPQYRLLLFLRHGPKRAGELAAEVAIKRPTLTALVAGLEKESRLRRVADETDGRGVRIEITSAGTAALERTEATLVEVVEKLCTTGNREGILATFDDLAGLIDGEFERRLRHGGSIAPESAEAIAVPTVPPAASPR